ncbi:hypothetical protein ABZP36_019526 [Zizania latifolia]
MEGKAVSALLLLLLPVVLLLQPPRALAENLSIGVLDIAASWSRFLDLLTRMNIILLCNAILLIVLWDAGILASPAHYHGGGGGSGSVAAAPSTVAGASASASSRTRRRLPQATNAIVVWRQIKASAGAGAADKVDGSDVALNSRLRHRLHRPEPATRALRRTEEEKQRSEGEIAMAESKSSSCSNYVTSTETMSPRALPPTGAPKQSSACLDYPADHAAAAGEVAMADDHENSLCSGPDHSAGSDTNGICEDEAPDQFADDVDDMNRRFEEFIANTRRKMLLESMQLVLEV